MTAVLRPEPLRTLTLRRLAGAPAFLSAASGLVAAGDRFYVVADDELHLGVFPATGRAPGSRHRLLPGQLPAGKAARKAAKPDFEVLVRVPRSGALARGGLLALGSGSRPGRRRAVFLPLDRAGEVAGVAVELDARGFYARLEAVFGTLNLEGAAVTPRGLCVLNRGRPRHGDNACAWLDLDRVLGDAGALGGPPARVRRVTLGRTGGIPLCFTDAAALPDGSIVFTAVAEDAANAYDDGPCRGAAIGVLRPDGALARLAPVAPVLKLEGIAVAPGSRGRRLLLVTDADDPAVPARLYGCRL